MIDKNVQETERLLAKASKACKIINIIMKVVVVFLCLWWLVSIGVMVGSLAIPGFSDNPVTIVTLLGYVLCGIAMVAICVTLIKIFSDSSKGLSPFTMLQARRLKTLAVELLIYAALEFGLTCAASMSQQGWMNGSTSGVSPTLNLFPFVAAAVIFAFSFVFKYGVLLQKLSDETL